MPPNCAPARPSRVLVADDDDAMCALVCDALSDEGYEVLTEADLQGGQVGRLLDGGAGGLGVDLVVTDYRMPGMDGLEVLAVARRGDNPVPVILVSAFADADLREAAQGLGVSAVLAKPFALSALIDAVRDALLPVEGAPTGAPADPSGVRH